MKYESVIQTIAAPRGHSSAPRKQNGDGGGATPGYGAGPSKIKNQKYMDEKIYVR
jgi:hypothetical protein